MNKTAIVTGASSGIGRAVAAQLVKNGCQVYGFSRRAFSSEGVTCISCDITDEAVVTAAVDQVISESHRIDILVLCAGMGISGAVEFTDERDSRRQIEINLFGTDRVTRAVLPYMRQQKSGNIVIISSVAAAAAIPFQTWYSVSKAALNTYSLALANEVRPYGIKVCTVMPGDIRTGFTDARIKHHQGDEAYGGRIDRSVGRMEKDEREGMSPEKAGQKIVRIALKKNPKPYYSIGFSYSLICVLLKILPARFARFMLYHLYAK